MRCVATLVAFAAAASAARLMAPGIGCGGKAEYVDGEYIVVLKRSVATATHDAVVAQYAARKFSIGSGLKAFRALHASLSAAQLDDVLAHPDVDYVERNQIARIADARFAANTTVSRSCPNSQSEPLSWGQKRVTAGSAADVEDVYAHDAKWGEGVNVYVLDTGVRVTHEEFSGGRAVWGANFAGGADQDNNGHGTHCAGTIAGKTYGVAKAAKIVAVKVLGDSGSGSYSGIISGVEYAAKGGKGVANMSLGGGKSSALNDAVNAAASEGVLFSNAAGNCNSNSCNYSPASAEDGLCVGSTELASQGGAQVDARSSFSNYGACNDVFAPGSSIIAAYRGSDTAYATLSGTSMAAPHAAGVAAIALQQHPSYSAAQLKKWVEDTAMGGLVNNPGTGTPNRMLHYPC